MKSIATSSRFSLNKSKSKARLRSDYVNRAKSGDFSILLVATR